MNKVSCSRTLVQRRENLCFCTKKERRNILSTEPRTQRLVGSEAPAADEALVRGVTVSVEQQRRVEQLPARLTPDLLHRLLLSTHQLFNFTGGGSFGLRGFSQLSPV